jgi:hypothetical protein
MDPDKMTAREVRALMRLLAEWEREELELVKQERREAEREGCPIEDDPKTRHTWFGHSRNAPESSGHVLPLKLYDMVRDKDIVDST